MDLSEMVARSNAQEWRGIWKYRRIPGGIKLSTRQRFLPGDDYGTRESLLVEDVVLEALPLELEQPERLLRRR